MPPETGWVGYLVSHNWLNVIAFGLAAVLVLVLTCGRLGYQSERASDSADALQPART
jgi:hypothetical protein